MKRLKIVTLVLASIFIIAVTTANEPKQQDIKYAIFDLGGVVYGTDNDKFTNAVGKSKFVWAGAWAIRAEQKKKVKAEIRSNMFEILNGITPRKPGQIICKDDSGEFEIPQIMCDWMQGVPCKQLMKQIHDHIDNNPEIFKNSSQKDLYTAIIDAALTPEIFVDTRYFYEEAQKLAEWCLQNGLELYGLTNWNGEAFAGIKKRDPEFFALFKGFISSSDAKTMKPGPGIFKHAEQEWKKVGNFNLAQAVLIDDQPENIDGAKAVGAQGILVTKTEDNTPELDKVYGHLTKLCNIKNESEEETPEPENDNNDDDDDDDEEIISPATPSIYFKV